MKIKVSSGFAGVLPTGSYQNSKPSFLAEVEFEYLDGGNFEQTIKDTQDVLQKICYDKFQSVAEQARVDFVKAQKANFRFHPYVNEQGVTEQYVSVSTVASHDKDFSQIPPHELNQYCSHGNLEDLRCKHFIESGEWLTVDKIQGSYADLAILKNGNLKLQAGTFDFPAFLKKFPITEMKTGQLIFSHKHKFAGTPDMTGLVDGKNYLCDFKRTPDKSYFVQLGGYAIALEESGFPAIEGLMLIGVNSDTQQGFSKPITTTEVEQCKGMFIKKREEFKKIFLV